ncbi:LuxR C-terminal-related transcriptional regulator [Streptomyces sp. CB02923]|uniref:LuxR C-terminal-related transcriptional regulator n=1 Tax=Streptomyces sp. CB02923 TaxID=1718985 RepID=UPI00093FE9B3|nr:LuxR C-terminal-related transcriptional regulator [Streptomyces sp. CB02923]
MRRFDRLAAREREVLDPMAQGHSNRPIADVLAVTEPSVERCGKCGYRARRRDRSAGLRPNQGIPLPALAGRARFGRHRVSGEKGGGLASEHRLARKMDL